MVVESGLLERLQQLAAAKLITLRKHPVLDLWIANYTDRVQYDRLWDTEPELVMCRGLIVDGQGNIVSHPFHKFFNLGEGLGEGSLPVPDGPYEVWRKYDGSLGISYWAEDGLPALATRGDFRSHQAVKGTDLLRTKYRAAIPGMAPGITYLFEIIYPQNRIVVDYGDEEQLILLGGYRTADHTWIDPERTAWNLPCCFPIAEMLLMSAPEDIPASWAMSEEPNEEGYVLRWPETDYRLKVKLPEYVRLHRLLTGLSIKHIWEVLKEDGVAGINRMLDSVVSTPEFSAWLGAAVDSYMKEFERIRLKCQQDFDLRPDTTDRKTLALYFQTKDYPHVLYAMLDERRVADNIWRLLEPERGTAVANRVFRKDYE